MEDVGLVGDLAVVAAAAVVGGAIARFLRLPTVIGYLAAGIALGPNTPGPSGDIEDVRLIADLGVALLMFTLGVRFSFREMNELKGMALGGGFGVTALMGLVGCGAGLALGVDIEEAVIVGMVVSISSSMVALRLMEDRGLVGAVPGRLTVSVALSQDIAVIPMLTLIPVIAGDGGNFVLELLWAATKAIALIAGLWIISTLLLPRVLGRIAGSRTRELFLILVIALALGTATLSAEAGLSIAFGAFLAGLLISESEYSYRALVEVLPLREVFAIVFFVGIGMLIDPDSFIDDPHLVFGIAGVGLAVKAVLIGGVGILLGYPARAVIAAAVALANMGEFSFVLAEQAIEEELLSPELSDAMLASVVLTMAVSPLLFMFHERALATAEGLPVVGAPLRPRTGMHIPAKTHLVNHAIIVGYTAAGREVASALEARDFRYIVIDEDPNAYRLLRETDTPVVLGDAALPSVLEQASIDTAWTVVITGHDPGQNEAIAAASRQLNQRVDVISRGVAEDSPERLTKIGVSRVVQEDFEVGQQFVRHTLQRFGMTSQEVQAFLLARRRRQSH